MSLVESAVAGEPRAFDPRVEEQGRLKSTAERLGARLVEALNDSIGLWLGEGLVASFESAAVIESEPSQIPGVVMQPLKGSALAPLRMVAEGRLFYRFFERMLSGTGSSSHPRKLGSTELSLGRDLAGRWAACLPGLAARPSAADLCLAEGQDVEPLPAQAWPMLRLRLSVTPGEDGDHLEFWMPLSVVDGAAHAAHAPSAARLGQAPVKLKVLLARARLRLKDLRELRVGDCVLMETGPEDEAVVLLSHEPVFKARPGRQGRHLAVQVTRAIQPEQA